jgi:putative endonuclease
VAKHNDIGKQGEEAALNYLQNIDYEIIETNWRFKHLEVDIIAKHKEYIVFIEVKARSINFFSEPEKAVTIKKQKNLVKTNM